MGVLGFSRLGIHEFDRSISVHFLVLFAAQNADYTTGQVSDLSEKLEQAESSLGRAALVGSGVVSGGAGGPAFEERRSEDRLAKAARDATKTSIEALHGLLAQVVKDRLFNQVRPRPC